MAKKEKNRILSAVKQSSLSSQITNKNQLSYSGSHLIYYWSFLRLNYFYSIGSSVMCVYMNCSNSNWFGTYILVILHWFRFHKSCSISLCDPASVYCSAMSASCTVKQEHKYFIIFVADFHFIKSCVCTYMYVNKKAQALAEKHEIEGCFYLLKST